MNRHSVGVSVTATNGFRNRYSDSGAVSVAVLCEYFAAFAVKNQNRKVREGSKTQNCAKEKRRGIT
jgi:hypothetical protein